MEYRKIGKSGIKASTIALGTWGMGGGERWQNTTNDSEAIYTICQAMDAGINFIDTAPVYGLGHAESVVARALEGKRDRAIISTKCGVHWRNADGEFMYIRDGADIYKSFDESSIRKDLHDSLKRLKTDYIDVYIAHRVPQTREGAFELSYALQNLKKEGLIRAVGISNASATVLGYFLEDGTVDLVQEKFNIMDNQILNEYMSLCLSHSVSIEGYNILLRGLLTGKIPLDYRPKPNDAHGVIKWFEPKRLGQIVSMVNDWRSIAEKYGCSLSALSTAYCMKAVPNLFALIGARTWSHLDEILPAAGLVMEQADFLKMSDDADKVRNIWSE
jgi:methylglyoxal reductase